MTPNNRMDAGGQIGDVRDYSGLGSVQGKVQQGIKSPFALVNNFVNKRLCHDFLRRKGIKRYPNRNHWHLPVIRSSSLFVNPNMCKREIYSNPGEGHTMRLKLIKSQTET